MYLSFLALVVRSMGESSQGHSNKLHFDLPTYLQSDQLKRFWIQCPPPSSLKGDHDGSSNSERCVPESFPDAVNSKREMRIFIRRRLHKIDFSSTVLRARPPE